MDGFQVGVFENCLTWFITLTQKYHQPTGSKPIQTCLSSSFEHLRRSHIRVCAYYGTMYMSLSVTFNLPLIKIASVLWVFLLFSSTCWTILFLDEFTFTNAYFSFGPSFLLHAEETFIDLPLVNDVDTSVFHVTNLTAALFNLLSFANKPG